jgi:hypothetical protein
MNFMNENSDEVCVMARIPAVRNVYFLCHRVGGQSPDLVSQSPASAAPCHAAVLVGDFLHCFAESFILDNPRCCR